MSEQKVCVTGGTGFIGGALVRRLLAGGNEVRVLARPSRGADDLEALGAKVVRGNVRDSVAADGAVAGAKVVYHTSAKVEGSGSLDAFMDTNVGGTQKVLQACVRQGVRHMVYISSIAVYGPALEGEAINEDTPLEGAPRERDFYAQSKIAAEEIVTSFAGQTGLAVTILRPGIVFGPGRELPVALLGVRRPKANWVFGTRTQHFPLTYIENLVDAIELAGQATSQGLKKYIVIDDENLTLGKYHETLGGLEKRSTLFFPGWPVIFASTCHMVPSDNGLFSKGQVKRGLEDRLYDTRRIREELGWRPKVPLREALQGTLKTSTTPTSAGQ